MNGSHLPLHRKLEDQISDLESQLSSFLESREAQWSEMHSKMLKTIEEKISEMQREVENSQSSILYKSCKAPLIS